MPWQTLELDPATATMRDVKRAYATRLKSCRPDQDPEGFRRLHEAYSAALDELQWRDTPDAAPAAVVPMPTADAEAGPPAAIIEAPAAPALSHALAAVVEVLDRLDAALKSRTEGVASLVREAEAVARIHPTEVLRWGEIMHDLIRDHAGHEDLRLTPEALLFELEHHGVAATIAVIDRIDREGNARGIKGLSGLLVENKKRIATPAGGIAAARLAGAAAFWAPGHVEPLSDLAYETLARGERDFHMALIDRHAEMRRFLSLVPDRLKSFLRQRLMDEGGYEVWRSEDGAAAIAWLKTSQGRSTPVYEVIRQRIPDEIARTAGLSLRQPGAPGSHREERPLRPQRTPIPKSKDEFDWDEEIPAATDAPPRPSAEIPGPKPKPKLAAEPTPPASRQNWLDEETRPARRPSGNRHRPHPPSSGMSRTSWGKILAVIFVVKVVLLLLRLLIAGGQ